MGDNNTGLRVGAAGGQAASVLTGALAAGMTVEQVVKAHGDLTADFVANMETIQSSLEQGASVSQASAMIGQAFPGTTTVPVTQFQAAAPVMQAAPAQAQPAAIPGVADGDAQVSQLWTEFFSDPSRFWDNRSDKRNPRAPDFKNKDNGDKALWLQDKKNPSWVGQQLAAVGMA
tara:strand:+ start:64 stop:585 length:522 start_codon:yes stop_codon:yes gene_type:complete